MDITEALKERGYEIDRRRVTLREAIKETGEFTVNLRLHREVNVEIPVIVTGEGSAQAQTSAPETAAPATEAEAARTDNAEGSPEPGIESASTVE
jgi:large subunit ribosomal protein L9